MWPVKNMIDLQVILELIKIKKMNQSFDKQIFGEVVEVIRPEPSCLLANRSNPSATLRNASMESQQNYSNSSSRGDGYGNQRAYRNKLQSLTNCTDSNSAWKSGCEIRGLRKHKMMENSNKLADNKARQLNLKRVAKTDNFYCACCEREDKNGECLACHGAGFADGNNNIVKFIEYIMEFKLGIKKSYKNQTSKIQIVVKSQKQKQQNSQEKQKQSKTLKNIGASGTISEENKAKKAISLSTKVPAQLSSSLASLSSKANPNRINQFCSQFLKSHSPSSFLTSQPINPSTPTLQQSSKLKATHSTINTNSNANNFSLLNEENNVSSINVGIYGMTESIIDEGFNGSAVGVGRGRDKGEEDGTVGECYGYERMESTNSRIQPTTQSMLSNSCKPKLCPAPKQPQPQNLSQMKQRLSLQTEVHKGYSCNLCGMDPIEGPRYHCSSLMCEDDYDLCALCYRERGHKHNMVEMRGVDLGRICEGLEASSSKSIKYSARMSLGAASCLDDRHWNQINQNRNNNNLIFKSSIH